MTIEELIDALEEKRELLKKVIVRKDMNLNDKEVLAYSQELDELITAYLSVVPAGAY